MFDLENSMETFLLSINQKRFINQSCKDEIESHIRDEVESLVNNGICEEEAFAKAIQMFGSGEEILKQKFPEICPKAK